MTSIAERSVRAGTAYPHGAHSNAEGVNFSLFSAHATRVELCLFDSTGRHELERIDLPEFTDETWHGHVAGLGPGTVYGYRVHGPYEPEAGHRFNPNKLLLDPYARAHVGSLEWNDACFGYTIGAENADLSFDTRDSAPFVPKAVVVDPSAFDTGGRARPNVSWEQTIIYELHVGGYTRLRPDVPERQRGTFAGLCSDGVIAYIKSLGVTAVELLPVQLFVNDRHLVERGLTNYWGYNTIGFFAPDPRYAADHANAVRGFREMVARFHDAGLEVILDVVYNHSAEGSELGPTLSFRGLDNASYYRLASENRRYYSNEAGTGNTLNLRHPRVTRMITDSLRYWATDMQVDGFRFDLGTTLSRTEDCFDEHSAFLTACIQDPTLAQLKLIAEPWDCGPDGYQVGRFPPGWAEWNDKFRDAVRDFWRRGAPAGVLSPRLCASADAFDRRGRKPWASINFVTSHDGFTLRDLVSYAAKHNEANGEQNGDGTHDNSSCNYGIEGPSDDPEIVERRLQQSRNMLATLLMSRGTPMLLGGDEIGRTQGGNNNAYCQDNVISWVDWEGVARDEGLLALVRELTALRREIPLLSRTRFLTGEPIEPGGLKDVTWLVAAGTEITSEEWVDTELRCFGMLLAGDSPPCLIVMNAGLQGVVWTLPEVAGERRWAVRLDTSRPGDSNAPAVVEGAFEVAGQSLVLMQVG